MVVVRGTFVSRNDGRTIGEARSVVVFEDGEWKLDSLDSRYRATARVHGKTATPRSAPTLEARIKELEDYMGDPDKVATPRARVETAAPPAPMALGASPEDAMQAILKAAREKDMQALRAGTSRSLQAIADDDGPMGALNDLRHLTFVRARTLNETTAEVILRSTDAAGKEREIPFQMIMEDGTWKLTEVGHSTPVRK